MCWVFSLGRWLLGRASSHSGLPSFTFGLIWKGVELLESQKLEVSSCSGCSASTGEALRVLVDSAGVDALFMAEAPPGQS